MDDHIRGAVPFDLGLCLMRGHAGQGDRADPDRTF